MTSRALTFGFDFWSCGHLRKAVAHFPTKFGAYIFIHCGNINISRKFKMMPSTILYLLGSHRTTTKAHSWCVLPVKISSWSA